MGSRAPDPPSETPSPRGKKAPPQSVSCKVRVGRGEVRRGTATLTPDELRFHTGRTGREGADFYLHIRYEEITRLVADGPKGLLTVTTEATGDVVFHLGRIAVAWKELIEDRPDLLRELGLTARSRVALVAVDDEALVAALGERAQSETGDGLDALFAGAEHRLDLQRLPALAKRVRAGGVVWVVVSDGARGLGELEVAAAGRGAGLVGGHTVELSPGRLAVMLIKS